MPKIVIDLPQKLNRVIEKYKAEEGFRLKEEAVLSFLGQHTNCIKKQMVV